MGWFRGVITRKAQARTSDRYDFRVFLETDGSTRSVKLPLAKYSVDGAAAAEGSWALLSRYTDEHSSEDSENEREEEFEDEFGDESEEGGGVGSTIESSEGREGSLNEISDVGPTRAGGRKRTPNVRLQDQG